MEGKKIEKSLQLKYDFSKSMVALFLVLILTASLALTRQGLQEPVIIALFFLIVVCLAAGIKYTKILLSTYSDLKNLYK